MNKHKLPDGWGKGIGKCGVCKEQGQYLRYAQAYDLCSYMKYDFKKLPKNQMFS